MKPALPLFSCFNLMLPAASAATQPEALSFDLGLDWVSVSSRQQRGVVSVEYVRRGDDAEHPRGRFTYVTGILRGKRTPEQQFQIMKADNEKNAPALLNGM